MPASHYIDNESRLIITTWEGDAIDIDFIEALKKYQEDIQNKSDYLDYNEMVNLRKTLRIRLSVKGLKNIVKIASGTDKYRPKTKLALIVSSNLAYNFARLYATYRNFGKKNKKQIRVFKSESDALDWIRNNT